MIPSLVSQGSQPIETLSFVRVIHLTVTLPTPRSQPKAVAKAPVAAQVVRVRTAHAPPASRRTQRRRIVRSASPLPHAAVVAAVVAYGNGTAKVKAPSFSDATPVPAQAPAQAAPQRQQIGGMLPLGMDEPSPVLDPAVLKALVALGVHVTLTVTVDENGRTQAVAFAPPLDASIESEIRSVLASASWDPAVCGGGMACEADATIKL